MITCPSSGSWKPTRSRRVRSPRSRRASPCAARFTAAGSAAPSSIKAKRSKLAILPGLHSGRNFFVPALRHTPEKYRESAMKISRVADDTLAVPLLFAAPLAGPAWAADPVPSAKDYPPPPADWKVPRTEWGDPDLRGMWPVDYLAATPRERPPEIGTRTEWTEEEYQERFAQAEQRAGLEAAQDRVGILGMGHWREDGLPLWQTSMITQPANGRYPALTDEGRRAAAAVRNSWNTEVFDKISDFGIWDRCLSRGMPG